MLLAIKGHHLESVLITQIGFFHKYMLSFKTHHSIPQNLFSLNIFGLCFASSLCILLTIFCSSFTRTTITKRKVTAQVFCCPKVRTMRRIAKEGLYQGGKGEEERQRAIGSKSNTNRGVL